MTLKGRGAKQLSLEEKLVTNTGVCALIRIHKQHGINMASSLTPRRTQEQAVATLQVNTTS